MRGMLLIGAATLASVTGAAPTRAITVPAGVRYATVARGVGTPTNIAFDPAGGMWITSGAGGPLASDGVWYVRRPGMTPVHAVSGLHTALGLTWLGGTLYVTSVRTPRFGQVTALTGFNGHGFRTSKTILSHLPIGRHTVDTILPGPGNRLYLGIGSEFDNRTSTRKLAGTVVSFGPTGRGLRIEAAGLRNPYGLAFIGGTSRLLVTDNGRDDLGAFSPPDELDLVPASGPAPDFGFPACYDQGGAACAGKRQALVHFAAHASSDGLAVTKDWGGQGLSAFIAENGSSFPANPTGNDVIQVRLRTHPGGVYTASKTTFARGFAKGDPLGAAIGHDGRLYVTLFNSGTVVRFQPPAG